MSETLSSLDVVSKAGNARRSVRALKDYVARYGITIGGINVIIAICLIFIYLLAEVMPLFSSASIEPKAAVAVEGGQSLDQSLHLLIEEQKNLAGVIQKSGDILFFNTVSGELQDKLQISSKSGEEISELHADASAPNLIGTSFSTGRVQLTEINYQISYPQDQRTVTPVLNTLLDGDGAVFTNGSELDGFAVQKSGQNILIAAHYADESHIQHIAVQKYAQSENFLTGEVIYEQQSGFALPIEFTPSQLLLESSGRFLFATFGHQIKVFDIREKQLVQVKDLPSSEPILSAQMLLGGNSVLIAQGHSIHQLFMVAQQDQSRKLQLIRSLPVKDKAVLVRPEQRRKSIVAVTERGELLLLHTTSEREVLRYKLDAEIANVAVAPRGDGLIAQRKDGRFQRFEVKNKHPEVSWSVLWDEVWYESYQEPDYVWQSSAATTDYEPKFSLMPLAFGTLKAAFYAMLMATPLAICGAIYTAYFMAPALRRKVKPFIELMEALPTVILGFLAGLWLAPFVEANLPGTFAVLFIVPISILLFSFLWAQLPNQYRFWLPEGWDVLLLIPIIILSTWFALSLSDPLEALFFDGSMVQWLETENEHGEKIGFDQRNSLIVGLAMGFAVIPTIFSIAEDAIFSVPKHLTYGSLALGATPWQTLVRIVLPTASPGIFSGVMIGMGRAVGETMIVLMATGSTPIIDANIFEGMRTLAANIAIEMPESEVGSSHYRILFLAALVLFTFTFIVNTLAEIIRHRLRKKYGAL